MFPQYDDITHSETRARKLPWRSLHHQALVPTQPAGSFVQTYCERSPFHPSIHQADTAVLNSRLPARDSAHQKAIPTQALRAPRSRRFLLPTQTTAEAMAGAEVQPDPFSRTPRLEPDAADSQLC